MRTDQNNNPTAFTTDLAREAGLVLGVDYAQGDQFPNGEKFWTAKLLGDPVTVTCRLIDKVGFFTSTNAVRWGYIEFPHFVWLQMTPAMKRDVIGWMYQREGGVAMRDLFPNYGKS